MPDVVRLLIALMCFVLVSSGIGALLLLYITGLSRFSAFFKTLQETVSWALFVILGLEALFSFIFCHIVSAFCWFGAPISHSCRIDVGVDLFLHSTFLTIVGLGVAVTIIQFLFVRDVYRISDQLLFCLLALSSVGGCLAWFICKLIF